MAYTTQKNLEDKYGARRVAQISGDSTGNTADADKITAAISTADALIDGYVQKRYNTPLVTPPALIGRLSTDIAYIELKRGSALGLSDRDEKSETRLMSILRDISKGLIDLEIDTNTDSAVQPTVGFQAKTRQFGRVE